MFTEHGFT